MNLGYKVLYPLLFILLPVVLLSQAEAITVTGRLLDNESKEPVVFASVYLSGGTIGTTSNEEGYFTFHIPSINDSAKVIISSIGYESIERSPYEFIKDEVIVLNSKMGELAEVLIKSTKKKKLSAKKVVRKAYKQIKNNYPTESYITEGFVRDLQVEDSNYVEYLECAVKFYNQPHSIANEPDIELVEVKTNHIGNKHPWNDKWERKNSIMDLVEDDFIRFDYGPIKGRGAWKYAHEEVLFCNNRYVYKISAVNKPYQKATLYIDTESFAFVRLELTRSKHKGKSWKRRLANGQQIAEYSLVMEYQEYNGKMYLKYKKEEDTWEIYDLQNPKKLLFTKSPKKELFVNKVVVDNVEQYPFESNMNISRSLEDQAKEYNAEFWSKYNAPARTKEMSKIEEYLKQKAK